MVLGKKALLQAAFLNGAPHHAMGRPMKAGKEEIMGLLTAVEAWLLGRDHAAEWRQWEGYLARIRGAVADLPGVKTRVLPPGIFNVAPTLAITWDQDLLACTPSQAHRALWQGEPRITLHLIDGGIEVMPYMMEVGDDVTAAARIRQVLVSERSRPSPPELSAASLAGDWEVIITYVYGESRHAMSLTQERARLSGRYRSGYATSAVAGQVTGTRVELATTFGYQSNQTVYAFTGQVDDQGLSGEVELGEFGAGKWRARRLDLVGQ
jgi:L-seryl-tRNA(Ser) seleniumtransferase